MAAVVVDPESETRARAAIRQLRTDFSTPAKRPLSWKEDVRNDRQRALHASLTLSRVPGIRLLYVVVNKELLAPGTYGDDLTLFYNYIAYNVLKRVLWAANYGPGGRSQVDVRFGHVAHHDHRDTHRYFHGRRDADRNVPFDLLSSLTWTGASQFEMSQVADLYGGFLKQAFWADKYCNVDGDYLVRVWHQIRQPDGCAIHLGLMPAPSSEWAKSMSWFPCTDCPGG